MNGGAMLHDLSVIVDPRERALAAKRMMDDVRTEMGAYHAIRRAAIVEAVNAGMTQAEVARRLGITRARVNAIIKGRG